MEIAYLSILFSLPVIAILIARFAKLSIFSFSGVYLLFAATSMFCNFMLFDLSRMLLSLGVAVVAAGAGIGLIGLLGEKYANSSYINLTISLGLYPWFVDSGASIFYGSTLVAIILFSFLLSRSRARSKSKKYSELKPHFILGLPVVVISLSSLLFVI